MEITAQQAPAKSLSCYLTPQFYADIYLVMASLIALTLLFSYPPLQSPHERQHYLRGLTFSTLYKDGTLPRSIFQFIKKVPTAPESSLTLGEVTGLSLPIPAEALQQELNDDARKPFTSSSNVAVYPFVDYVPQIIAGTVGDLFSLKPFLIFYLARALCLTFGAAFGYLILRLLPAYHTPVIVALLFPSVWVMRIQQYADQTVIIAAFLYFALVLRALTRGHRIRYRDLAAFSITGLLLSASKIVYFPLTFSIALIPTGQFASLRQRMAYVGIVLIVSIAASGFGVIQALRTDYGMTIGGSYTPDSQDAQNVYKPERWPRKQAIVQKFIAEPLDVIGEVAATYVSVSFWRYQSRDILIWVKNNYAKILDPFAAYPVVLALSPFFLSLTALPSAAVTQPPSRVKVSSYWPTLYDRALLSGIVATVAILVGLALYTDSFRINDRYIQGRYLVPLLPFVALLLSIHLPSKWYARGNLLQLAASLSIICILYLGIIGIL